MSRFDDIYIPEFHCDEKRLFASKAVFTWIDSPYRYDTTNDLCLADVMRKRPFIFIAGNERFEDIWFIYEVAHFVFIEPSLELEPAFEKFIECRSKLNQAQSPIETIFMKTALLVIDNLSPQVQIGPYRVDFAIKDKGIVIELDGHDYHKTKEQRTRDASRQRYLEINGWRVIRFTGTEIYNSAERCVNETLVLINKWS